MGLVVTHLSTSHHTYYVRRTSENRGGLDEWLYTVRTSVILRVICSRLNCCYGFFFFFLTSMYYSFIFAVNSVNCHGWRLRSAKLPRIFHLCLVGAIFPLNLRPIGFSAMRSPAVVIEI